jgi:hypothetical protein
LPFRRKHDDVGNLILNVKDPEGHTVEFVQYRPGSLLAKSKGRYLPEGRVSKRLMHVGIIVTKLAPEMKFYTEVLGFREFWRGSSTGTELSWINLKIPDGEDYIELMLYKEAPAATARGSAHHQCLEVPDVQATLTALEANLTVRSTRAIWKSERAGIGGGNSTYSTRTVRERVHGAVTVDGKPAQSSDAPPPELSSLGINNVTDTRKGRNSAQHTC